MKRKHVLIVLLAAVLLFLIGWRLWPHSFRAIASEEAFSEISIQVSETGLSDGAPVINFYQLVIDGPENEHYAAVLSILEGTGYRSDFRNLLWKSDSLGSDSETASRFAAVTLTGESGTVWTAFFPDSRVVGISQNQHSGFLRYHPADHSVSDRLAAYAIEHGTLQK